MKIVFPLLDKPIQIYTDKINVLTVENKKEFYRFVTNLYNQFNKGDGPIVMSKDDIIIDFSKHADFLYQLIPFDINKKTLVNKLHTSLFNAVNSYFYKEWCQLQSDIERLILDIGDVNDCNVTNDLMTIPILLKAVNLRFSNDYDTLCDAIIDYFLNVLCLEGDKLFVVLNLREFISDDEYTEFKKTVIGHKIKVLLISSNCYPAYQDENVTTIDEDLCVI